MYRTAAFDEPDLAELHAFVRSAGAAHLVTRCRDTPGLDATMLPFLLDTGPADGPLGTLRGHVARANPLWREATDDVEALVIFAGPDAYVSPSWYATKREHGKVVPTWNYEVVHAHGPLVIHDDPEWLRNLVTRLTDRYEDGRPDRWAVTDAPPDFVTAMLRGIVGIEIPITRMEGKRKLSQNRSAEDVHGAIEGLARGNATEQAVSAAMARARDRRVSG